MDTILTFIIPVRHQENSKDWNALKANLTQTIASISAQTNPNWRAIIVANIGADLPDLPDKFEVLRVDFPPNLFHEQQGADKEVFSHCFRIDKGRRVLKGMLSALNTKFFMIVDDDDFVSNRLVDFVSRNQNAYGWKVSQGYIWGDRGSLLLYSKNFSNLCGTSLIVRADIYQLPASFELADEEYIKTMLGSHVKIGKILEDRKTPLADLPFPGAIYRIGHSNAHSKSPQLLKLYLFNKQLLSKPLTLLQNIFSFRYLDTALKKEFFGV